MNEIAALAQREAQQWFECYMACKAENEQLRAMIPVDEPAGYVMWQHTVRGHYEPIEDEE